MLLTTKIVALEDGKEAADFERVSLILFTVFESSDTHNVSCPHRLLKIAPLPFFFILVKLATISNFVSVSTLLPYLTPLLLNSQLLPSVSGRLQLQRSNGVSRTVAPTDRNLDDKVLLRLSRFKATEIVLLPNSQRSSNLTLSDPSNSVPFTG